MRMDEFYNNYKFFNDVIIYLQNRITELRFQVEFSHLLEGAKKISGLNHLLVNDVDKLIRVDKDIKAIFELKVRRKPLNSFVEVNASQFYTLRLLHRRLGCYVYYLIKTTQGYQLIPIDFDRPYEIIEKGSGPTRDKYVKIPIDRNNFLDKWMLMFELSKVLQGDGL